jgi:hypothetical protein
MTLTSKTELLGMTARRFKEIEHDGYGVKLRIRNLNDREKSRYDASLLTKSGEYNKDQSAKRRLLLECVVDEEGNPYFEDADLDRLQELDGGIIGWAFTECRQHCNLDKTVADAEKN